MRHLLPLDESEEPKSTTKKPIKYDNRKIWHLKRLGLFKELKMIPVENNLFYPALYLNGYPSLILPFLKLFIKKSDYYNKYYYESEHKREGYSKFEDPFGEDYNKKIALDRENLDNFYRSGYGIKIADAIREFNREAGNEIIPKTILDGNPSPDEVFESICQAIIDYEENRIRSRYGNVTREDWKKTDEWGKLESLGFHEVPRKIKRLSDIYIKHPLVDAIYTITQSGYVRRKYDYRPLFRGIPATDINSMNELLKKVDVAFIPDLLNSKIPWVQLFGRIYKEYRLNSPINKDTLDKINSSPDSYKIYNAIKKYLPESFKKIKDSGIDNLDLSADLGDLGF